MSKRIAMIAVNSKKVEKYLDNEQLFEVDKMLEQIEEERAEREGLLTPEYFEAMADYEFDVWKRSVGI